jgi:hypothetical protein
VVRNARDLSAVRVVSANQAGVARTKDDQGAVTNVSLPPNHSLQRTGLTGGNSSESGSHMCRLGKRPGLHPPGR